MAKKPKPTTSSPKPTTPSPAEPPPPSLKKHFESFVPAALALPKERITPLKSDVSLVYANVKAGWAEVLPHQSRLAAELPKLDLAALRTLPDLAEALLYAHAEVQQKLMPHKRAEMETRLAELFKLREMMLLQAEVFVLAGLVPEPRVAQIRSGKGLFDAAQDGVALSDLYAEYRSQFVGKHPFSDAQLGRIAELGHALMKLITPEGARTGNSEAAVQAMELRDRIYSLLAIRHTELRKAGFYLFGEEVEVRVPALGARQGKSRPQPTEPPPGPPV